MYRTQQIRLTESITDAEWDYLVYQCRQANNLKNCVVFDVRQSHFERTEPVIWFDANDDCRSGQKLKCVRASYSELTARFKEDPHYKALGGQPGQQAIKSVCESFSSYNRLLKLWFAGDLEFKPKMPGYRKSGGLSEVTIPGQSLRWNLEFGRCRLPISYECRADWKDIGEEIWLPGGDSFDPMKVAELRILPRNGELYAEYVYQSGNDGPTCNLALEHQQAIGIDHGLDNWLTVVSTTGKSFIVDGRRVKSWNQGYNKLVAKIQTSNPEAYLNNELAAMTEKRNRQMRDAVNKVARFIINWCLKKRVGHIIFGWNPHQKGRINLGKRNNQNFVQIPTARLKQRIKDLAEEVGIQFEETEESYTSKASFLDNDLLPTYGEKPNQWQPSGKRLKRGLYKTAQGWLINADANGAANVLKKVSTRLRLDLSGVSRGTLTAPKRYDVFIQMNRAYCRRSETACLKTIA